MSARGGEGALVTWTEAEDAIVRSDYPAGGVKVVQDRLPGRTAVAIRRRAAMLGALNRRRWRRADDNKLTYLWETGMHLRVIAQHMERTPSACYERAQAIGLSTGCPDGYEYLTAAAERTGYDVKRLRAICASGGARLHAALTLSACEHGPQVRKERGRRWFVDPDEVDAAVKQWLDAAPEPIESWSRRVEVDRNTLRRWLSETGAIKLKSNLKHVKVTQQQVDAALAAMRRQHEHNASTVTLEGAAAHFGVSKKTMEKWLRWAGIENTAGNARRWRLTDLDLERVRRAVTARATSKMAPRLAAAEERGAA